MAYYQDVREYLNALEVAGKLVRIKQPINKDTEMHPLVRLQYRGLPEEQRRAATTAFTAGSVLYTAAIGIAVVNAYAALAFQFLIAVYYAVDPLSRRAAAGAGDEPRIAGG